MPRTPLLDKNWMSSSSPLATIYSLNFKIPFKGAQTKPEKVAHASPVYTAKLLFNVSEVKDNSAAEFFDSILRSVYCLRFCNNGPWIRCISTRSLNFPQWLNGVCDIYLSSLSKRQAYTSPWL